MQAPCYGRRLGAALWMVCITHRDAPTCVPVMLMSRRKRPRGPPAGSCLQDVSEKMDAQAAERTRQLEENEELRARLDAFLEQFETFNTLVGGPLQHADGERELNSSAQVVHEGYQHASGFTLDARIPSNHRYSSHPTNQQQKGQLKLGYGYVWFRPCVAHVPHPYPSSISPLQPQMQKKDVELQLAQARAEQATSLAQQLQQRADLLAVGAGWQGRGWAGRRRGAAESGGYRVRASGPCMNCNSSGRTGWPLGT